MKGFNKEKFHILLRDVGAALDTANWRELYALTVCLTFVFMLLRHTNLSIAILAFVFVSSVFTFYRYKSYKAVNSSKKDEDDKTTK